MDVRKRIILALAHTPNYIIGDESDQTTVLEMLNHLGKKRPKVQYNVYPRPLYECPDCGFGLGWSEQYRCKFCPECGRMIEWEGFPSVEPPEDWPSYMGRYDWRLMDMWKHDREGS